MFSQLKMIYLECRCGHTIGPLFQNNSADIDVGVCPVCQGNGPFAIDSERTVYRNHQKVKLQESPGSVPAGRYAVRLI